MSSLGLPVPQSLFADATTAVATIKSIQGAIAIGGDVTIAELIGAGTLSEALAVAAGVTASFYVGALIGAAAYATGCVGLDLFATLDGLDPSGVDVNAWHQSGYEVAMAEAGGAGEGGDQNYA
jgi:hypothetical protein